MVTTLSNEDIIAITDKALWQTEEQEETGTLDDLTKYYEMKHILSAVIPSGKITIMKKYSRHNYNFANLIDALEEYTLSFVFEGTEIVKEYNYRDVKIKNNCSSLWEYHSGTLVSHIPEAIYSRALVQVTQRQEEEKIVALAERARAVTQ